MCAYVTASRVWLWKWVGGSARVDVMTAASVITVPVGVNIISGIVIFGPVKNSFHWVVPHSGKL